MQSKNKVIIAAAGSGKTWDVVEDALRVKDQRVLILTYTLENIANIKKYVLMQAGYIPANIIIKSWFSFLLSDGARPYKNFGSKGPRIETIIFTQGKSTQYVKKNKPAYFFGASKFIYSDKISEFTTLCNDNSGGLVIDRLEKIYDHIYIDEVQDLAGYDFDFLESLFRSKLKLTVVGDNRQATYFTNHSPKYSKYKGKHIVHLFSDWEKENQCHIEYKSTSRRCNQFICDFADELYPDMPRTKSLNEKDTGHDGFYFVREVDLESYMNKFNPQILRYDKRTESLHPALNFGLSKGQTYERVLILPNKTIRNFLATADHSYVQGSKSKFYVALTRARYSVAFLYEDQPAFPVIQDSKKHL